MRKHTHHRRRWQADPLAALRALAHVTPLDPSQQLRLASAYWMAWQSLTQGAGTDTDFNTLAAAINIGMVLAEQTPGTRDALDAFLAAQDALVVMHARHKRLGKWGVDAEAIRTIPAVLRLHDQQVSQNSGVHFRDAIEEVRRRRERGEVLAAD